MADYRIHLIVDAEDQASGPLQGVGQSLGGLAGLAGAAVAALGGLGVLNMARLGIDLNAAAEQSRVAFGTLLGSGQAAEAFLTRLRDFAAATPFEFPELADVSKKLLAMGFSAEQVMPMLTNIGDAISALGGTPADMERVALALGQMSAKGKVSAEEMMQLAELGIPAWQMLADGLGVTTAEAMKLAEKGLIPAGQAIDILSAGMGNAFGGAMQAQATTFNGLISTLSDNAKNALMAFTGPLFAQAKGAVEQLGAAVSSPAFQLFAAVLGAQLGAAITGLVGLLASVLPPAIAMAQSLFAQGSGSASLFAGAFTAIQSVVSAVMPLVLATVQAVLGQLLAFWSANGAQIVAFGQQTWTQLSTIVQTALTLIQGLIQGVLTFVLGFMQQHGAQIQQVMQASWHIISSLITAALALIQGTLSTALAIFQGDWSGAWAAIQAMSVTVTQALFQIITGALNLIAAFFGTSLSEIGTTWSSNLQKLPGVATDVMQAALAAFQAVLTQAPGVGKAIIDGIISGIGSALGGLIRAATDAARSALNAAKQALGIRSPSREFGKVGAFSIEGWADALRLGTPELMSVSAAAAEATTRSTISALDLDRLFGTNGAGNVASALRMALTHEQPQVLGAAALLGTSTRDAITTALQVGSLFSGSKNPAAALTTALQDAVPQAVAAATTLGTQTSTALAEAFAQHNPLSIGGNPALAKAFGASGKESGGGWNALGSALQGRSGSQAPWGGPQTSQGSTTTITNNITYHRGSQDERSVRDDLTALSLLRGIER